MSLFQSETIHPLGPLRSYPNCCIIFDHFVGLALKRDSTAKYNAHVLYVLAFPIT